MMRLMFDRINLHAEFSSGKHTMRNYEMMNCTFEFTELLEKNECTLRIRFLAPLFC